MSAATLTEQPGGMALQGDLTLETVRALYDRLPTPPPAALAVDLSAVGETDSAALALLLHWRHLGTAVTFHHAPPRLRVLAEITELGDLFAE